ncbi:hypothetical protein CEXT_392461 [Caerostris extrusa]|uniref:Uncharacterized protein n=1 Tax=Caerostris extrusa TaxID=172846 RepID=A0AAV4U6S8_CAEEX|nr:hypothetical protein CEXT_392461 [Caerostris extrusa]
MIAKISVFFAALVAVQASGLLGHGHLVNTGVSTSARSQDIRSRRCSRKQEGILHHRRHRRQGRRVDYVADGHGFRATVKTNEPRNRRQRPSCSPHRQPYAGPVAPVVNHVAPVAALVGHAASYAAPLAVAAPVAYGGVVGHGAVLGLGAPLGLGYGAGLGFGHGGALGLGYGLGLGKGLIH